MLLWIAGSRRPFLGSKSSSPESPHEPERNRLRILFPGSTIRMGQPDLARRAHCFAAKMPRLPRRLRRAGYRPESFHSRRLQLEDRAARLGGRAGRLVGCDPHKRRLISGARNPGRGVKPGRKTNRGRERLLHCPGSCRPFATFSNPSKP